MVTAGTETVPPLGVVMETVGADEMAGADVLTETEGWLGTVISPLLVETTGTLIVPPLLVVTVVVGTEVGIRLLGRLGTSTTVVTVVWPPLGVGCSMVMVSGPDEVGAGTTVDSIMTLP
jgi:hypothetical protein